MVKNQKQRCSGDSANHKISGLKAIHESSRNEARNYETPISEGAACCFPGVRTSSLFLRSGGPVSPIDPMGNFLSIVPFSTSGIWGLVGFWGGRCKAI